MTTMIEKVARAIIETANTPFPLSEYDAQCIARAAIEAMREPHPEMILANPDAGWPDDQHVVACWEAMIDAALKEGQ